MNFPQYSKYITACAQLYRLLHDFPESEGQMTSGQAFVWRYKLHPQANSDFYDIEIRYADAWTYPKVYVKTPLALYPKADKLPHVFDAEKQQICLNFNKEWDKTRAISPYYVPWASEWLFYYEAWVITGEWLGGGIHDGIRTE